MGSPTTGKKNEMNSLLNSFQFWLKFAVKTGVEKEKKNPCPFCLSEIQSWSLLELFLSSKNIFYGK